VAVQPRVLIVAARKTPSEVRLEAYRLAMEAAEERYKTGDPEGAEVIRELADDIRKIDLSK
jgi:hypothetical protein